MESLKERPSPRNFEAHDWPETFGEPRSKWTDIAKMASMQSKWLATLASGIVTLSGILLKLEIDKMGTTNNVPLSRVDARCAGFAIVAILIALTSMVMGSFAQATILRYMEGDKFVKLLSCCTTGRNKLFGPSVGDGLWRQRVLLYASVVVIILGFAVRLLLPA